MKTYTEANNLNQLTQRGGSGTTLVEGIVNEPAIVMVNDVQAAMFALPDGDYRFQRTVPVEESSNTITVDATDASQNVAINVYTVEIGGVLKTLEFDLNGNLRYERDDNDVVLREFQWDARNRLVAIIDGDNTTEFEYDGLDRRVRIVEKENGVEQSNVTFLWAGSEILQKRAANAETILRNYFGDGFTEGSNSYFYAKDHLGSVREVIAADGQTIESRYEYTPWGVVTRTEGTGVESDFLYTGHLYHESSGLFLAQYRAYDPETGRWLSRDPLGEIAGYNLYAYVLNDPTNLWDPLGLDWLDTASNFSAGVGDTLSFGATRWARRKINERFFGDSGDMVDRCSSAYNAGEWTGVGISFAAGGAAGLRAAGSKGAGREFSHWIPDRVLKRTGSNRIRNDFGRSKFNGNYVTPRRHAQHDPKRFLRGDRGMQGKFGPARRQFDRVPNVYKGGALGGAYGGASMLANDNGGCP